MSTFRILRELVVLNATHSLGLRPYFQYRLFDPALSPEDKHRYLPEGKALALRAAEAAISDPDAGAPWPHDR